MLIEKSKEKSTSNLSINISKKEDPREQKERDLADQYPLHRASTASAQGSAWTLMIPFRQIWTVLVTHIVVGGPN